MKWQMYSPPGDHPTIWTEELEQVTALKPQMQGPAHHAPHTLTGKALEMYRRVKTYLSTQGVSCRKALNATVGKSVYYSYIYIAEVAVLDPARMMTILLSGPKWNKKLLNHKYKALLTTDSSLKRAKQIAINRGELMHINIQLLHVCTSSIISLDFTRRIDNTED